jgi:hypothetical protein
MRRVFACWVGLACALTVPQPSAAQDMDIRDFVRQTFIHGVPYEEASRYGSAAVPILLGMLEDRREQEHWTNIVGVLGMIGDERAVDPLIAFPGARGEDRLTRPQYVAKSSVPLALGYLVNKTGSQRALSYLIESLNPDVWTQRGVTWQSPYHATGVERNLQLTTGAVWGLAVSGRPEAASALRAVQADTSAAGKRLVAQIGVVVGEALVTHAQIARMGLAEYYRAP